MSTMGERIAIARKAKGLQQGELAQIVNVKSAGVISNWETDKNKPDATKIIDLCRALDVLPSYILDYNGPDSFQLDPEERTLIEKFRNLSPHEKETIRLLVDRYVGRDDQK